MTTNVNTLIYEFATLREYIKHQELNLSNLKEGLNIYIQNNPLLYDTLNLSDIDISTFNISTTEDNSFVFDNSILSKEPYKIYEQIDASNTFNGSNYTSISTNNAFNNKHVINANNMFSNCPNLTTLMINDLNTDDITDMSSMFENDPNLIHISTSGKNAIADLSNFKTSKLLNTSYMFKDDVLLTEINISNFDFTNVSTVRGMFQGCSALKQIVFPTSSFEIRNHDLSHMFDGCSSLVNLNNFNTISIGYPSNMESMFANCTSLQEVSLSIINNDDIDNSLYNTSSLRRMFQNCSSLTAFNITKNENIENAIIVGECPVLTDLNYMFFNCSSLTSITISMVAVNLNIMLATFANCSNLETLNLTNLEISYPNSEQPKTVLTPMMLSGCHSLKWLYLSSTFISDIDISDCPNLNNIFCSVSEIDHIVPEYDWRRNTNVTINTKFGKIYYFTKTS